jgi:hypothetical protein
VGQLAFIGAILTLLWLARRFASSNYVERGFSHAAPYAIGALAGFWFVERVVAFWA